MAGRTLIFILLSMAALTLKGQVPEYKITWEYRDQTFADFVSMAEREFPVRFFYKDEWIRDIKIGDRGDQQTITGILDNLLLSRNLFYHIDKQGNIVLTKEYKIKSVSAEPLLKGTYLPPTDYSAARQRQTYNENIIVEIGNPADKNRSGNVTVTGVVRESSSDETIPGVTIFIRELAKGTVTDGNGTYSMSFPRGSYNIRFSCLGMQETSVNTRIYGSGKLDVLMAEAFIPISEAVITADRDNVHRRYEVGLEKLNMATFRLMPTSLGETDLLKNILMLPGVKTVGEGSAGFNVRGGAADQNLILLYGAPLFNPSHFFGFFSSVNSDVIKDVLLYKGGIPAQYGGRLSSVIDIVARDGSTEEFRGNAGISPVATHLLVETPLVKDKLSLILGARTTYSNWVLGMVNDPVLQNSRASFYDLNGRVVFEPDSKNKLELSSYLSHDSFRLNSDTTYSYDNSIISFKWRRKVNSALTFNLTGNTSRYYYNIESRNNSAEAFLLNYNLDFKGVKADFDWFLNNKQRINFGMEANGYSVLPGEYLPAGDSSVVAARTIMRDKAIEGAVYADDRITLTESLSLSLGLRVSLFGALGPRLIQLYDPSLPMSQATVYDTLDIENGKFYRTYGGPEFRASFNYILSRASSVKFNYNRTRQYLHLLTNTTSISPTDTWKLSDYYLRPQIADQFSAGYYLNLPWKNLEFSAEMYYKPIRNMVDFKGGTNLIMNGTIEKDIINVSGRAYGVELMVKKATGKFSWNVNYTYSRILVRSRTLFESDAINSGRWFPASHDKPHDLAVTFNYAATRRLNLSFNYTYNTGRPVTYPVAVYRVADQWVVQYSDRNKYRIPYYSRLDLSARWSGNLKSRKLLNPFWTLSCFNVLGRENVYSEYFRIENNQIKAYRLSVFARAIPTLSYSFDF